MASHNHSHRPEKTQTSSSNKNGFSHDTHPDRQNGRKFEQPARKISSQPAPGAEACADVTPKNLQPSSHEKMVSAATAMRLNKAIAASGLCSRRRADEFILAGRVVVNGVPEVNPGRQVSPQDAVAVDGRLLTGAQNFCYLMLYKPVQVVCTVSDPEGRPTVMDYLPEPLRKLRLYPVGRLDYFSEGLLLLTNDGQLAQRLTHPRHHQPKTYEVLVRGSVPEAALTTMRRGMLLAEGEKLMPVKVDVRPLQGRTLLRMVLHQGVNRQIRRMCRDFGLIILSLKRVAQGPLELRELAMGSARQLTQAEITALKKSVDM